MYKLSQVMVFFLTFSAFIQSASALDFQSSRTLSMAKSGRGGALLNDTITMNPSLLSFQPVSSFSSTYNWTQDASAGTEGPESRLFNVSVIDGKNPYVNAGVSFTRKSDLDLFHVALSRKIIENISVGIMGKRFATRDDRPSKIGKPASGFDGGASLSYSSDKDTGYPFQIGLVADNLLHSAEDEPLLGARQLGGGVKLNIRDSLLIYGDAVENFSRDRGNFPLYSGALELALGGDLYARGGLYGFRESGWSAGAGWIGPKLGLSYGYQTTKVEASRGYQHAVTMDLYM